MGPRNNNPQQPTKDNKEEQVVFVLLLVIHKEHAEKLGPVFLQRRFVDQAVAVLQEVRGGEGGGGREGG